MKLAKSDTVRRTVLLGDEFTFLDKVVQGVDVLCFQLDRQPGEPLVDDDMSVAWQKVAHQNTVKDVKLDQQSNEGKESL